MLHETSPKCGTGGRGWFSQKFLFVLIAERRRGHVSCALKLKTVMKYAHIFGKSAGQRLRCQNDKWRGCWKDFIKVLFIIDVA